MRTKLAATLLLLALKTAGAQTPPRDESSSFQAVVKTELGSFRFDLASDKAPKHVKEFIDRARAGFYDGSAFHRVVPNGLIQGGDPLLKDPKTPRNLWGTGGLNLLDSEPSDLKHERGVVSTVRTYKDGSDGSQFFVCLSALPGLDGGFSAFGQVTEGMDVVEKISMVPAAENTVVEKPVRIITITIEKKIDPR